MKLTELFSAELEREAAVTRRVLERVPEGHYDWKPHEKSMAFGYLTTLVATMPSWITLMLTQDELDFRPPGGRTYTPPELRTSAELVAAHDAHVAKALETLAATDEERLTTPWRFLAAGQVIDETPRHVALRDSVLNHWAHHRGQLTVYLRLLDAPVPSIYGPSADEKLFD